MAYNYILNTGVVVPDTSTTLAEVQQEYLDALGQDLNLDPNTPQGQLITAEVATRNGVIINNALVANQLNPNQATGTYLRAIGALMAINDTPTAFSVCLNVAVTGAPNSVFPVGTHAANAQGALFAAISTITLSATGTGVLNFQAVDPGPILAPAGTLVPSDPLIGWSSVNNPTDAVPGSSQMLDYQFRIYRQNALANQSQNSAPAAQSKLIMLPGITSVFVRENDADTQATINGIVMEPNSLYVCVNDNGGIDTDIAATLLSCKAPGCKWSQSLNSAGTPTNVIVTDPITGQQYSVAYTRSIPVNVFSRVTVGNNATMVDLSTAVIDAVVAYSSGQVPNLPLLGVGNNVSPFEIAGAVTIQLPGTYVALSEVSLDGATWQTTPLVMQSWQRPNIPNGNITVVVLPQ